MSTYTLGIDIGTTSVKVAAKMENNLIERSRPHNATESPGVQSVSKIVQACFATIDDVLGALPEQDLQLLCVAVCSQMHGVCTWNSREVQGGSEAATSQLYTWEFTGTNEEQLQQWRAEGFDVNPGFGSVTLAYLDNLGRIAGGHDKAGTIGDFFVSVLCDESLVGHVMSDQMAVSFGLAEGRKWVGSAAEPGNWQKLLASIVAPETRVGKTTMAGRVRQPVDVFVAFGDLQATMYPLLADERSVALNIGTSAQIAFRQSSDGGAAEYEKALLARSTCGLLPFFNNGKVIVSASMNGGNMVMSEIEARIGKNATNAEIATLLQAADKFAERNSNRPFTAEATGLFHCERGMPAADALRLHRIDPNDKRPIADEEAIAAVCRRVVANMLDLTPFDEGRHQIMLLVGSAACSRFAMPLRRELGQRSRSVIEIVKPEGSTSAAAGAAAFAWAESDLAP